MSAGCDVPSSITIASSAMCDGIRPESQFRSRLAAGERQGFEPSVPRQKDLCKHLRFPPIASAGGADWRENGENADLAPSREEIARDAVFLACGFRDRSDTASGRRFIPD